MSLDFIRAAIKSWDLDKSAQIVVSIWVLSFWWQGLTLPPLWDEILFYGADTKQESVNFKFQSNWWLIRLKFLGKLILKMEILI